MGQTLLKFHFETTRSTVFPRSSRNKIVVAQLENIDSLPAFSMSGLAFSTPSNVKAGIESIREGENETEPFFKYGVNDI
jgi:hypothetical protein